MRHPLPQGDRLQPRRSRAALLALTLGLGACGGGDGPTARDVGTPGVRLVSPAVLGDTIGANLPDVVTFEVRGADGTPAPGRPVRVSASAISRDQQIVTGTFLSVALCPENISPCTFELSQVLDTTDARGLARVRVRMGVISGRTFLRVAVPDFGYVDSVGVDVRAGRPATILKASTDTGVMIGERATLLARVGDRIGNVVPDVFPSTASLAFARLEAEPGNVTGTAFGSEWVRYTFEAISDSMRLRVLPPARLLTFNLAESRLALVDINGRNERRFSNAPLITSAYGIMPRFDVTRRRLMVLRGAASETNGPFALTVADTADFGARIDANFTSMFAMRALPDGTVLVVSRRAPEPVVPSRSGLTLWRVAVDGTVTNVATLALVWDDLAGMDISPDGRRIVYGISRGFFPSRPRLEVLDVASGAITVLRERTSEMPLWSPSGDEIVFRSSSAGAEGALTVIRPDGTGERRIGTKAYETPLSWSPSGEYVLVRPTGFSVEVVRVRDGVSVPATRSVSAADWMDWR